MNKFHTVLHSNTSFAAIKLVNSAVKWRGQDTMQPLLGFLTEILQRYNSTDETNRNHVEKDCALLTFGSISETLLKKKKLLLKYKLVFKLREFEKMSDNFY